MTMNKTLFTLAGLGAAAALAGAAFAQGRDAASLRASGKVGEEADGYMACVSTCDAETQAAIKAINDERREGYAQLARKEGVTTEAAGVASFLSRLNCTNVPQRTCIAAGQYYRPAGGSWTRK